MRTPPLYLACAVMFWAWHAQVPAVGAVVAALLEAPRIVRTRWRLTPTEFARIADLCTWAFVILAGYLIFARGMPLPILEIFCWLPLVMVPLIAAQLYSESGRLPLSALFLMLRGKQGVEANRSVDLAYPYAIVCALAAGAANVRHDAYYYGLLLLAAWALWPVRSRRYHGAVWAAMFVCIAALGYGGHVGLNRLQDIVMDSIPSLGGTRVDPNRNTTDIGQIGELKQSERIALRVAAPQGMTEPLLLHRASYNAYSSPTWLARDAPFAAVAPELGGTTWVLGEADRAQSGVVVSQPVERGRTVLALPNGTARIDELRATGVQRNRLGAVEIESRDDPVTYRPALDPRAVSRDPAQEIDLRVPRAEAAPLGDLVERLQLKGRPTREVLAIVKDYFEREFTYSLYQSLPQRQATPLADFLLVTRAGHCEYFATATTLLLRAAGVPARYAAGYSVQEWSPLENAYIARERHAHAWVRVRVDERWVDFDTTPPIWFAAEAQRASLFQPVSDLWSFAAYRLARWQREHPAASTAAALTVVALLAAFLIWRLLIRKPLSAVRTRKASGVATRPRAGADSEFYQVESQLTRAGCVRAPNESLRAWVTRLGRERDDIGLAQLQELLRLHYRYRFDPLGLSAAERRTLAEDARRWLQAHKQMRSGSDQP